MQLGSTSAIKADINVTPLVDVVLVLLIIFMVVTPMLQNGPPVQLPQTQHPANKPENTKEILVVIDDKGTYWVDRQTMTEDDFPSRMASVHEARPDGSVVIKGDSRLTFGKVKRAMFAVKDAGYTGVALVASRAPGSLGR